jgi:hypothetical protein
MTRIDDITLAGPKPLAMNCAKRRDKQQALTLDHQHKQTLAREKRFRTAPLRINR